MRNQTPHRSPKAKRLFAVALSCGLAGCAEGHPQDAADQMVDAPPAATPIPVTVSFQARVGSRPFACGQKYPGVGAGAGATIEAADFRLYVHDLRLVDTSGAELAVALDEDKKWQRAGVALLDFEDKSGSCTGTTETNHELRGTIPAGTRAWKGVRFKLGVPFSLNHADASSAASPLNLTSMFWSWQGGYKFLRIEGQNATGLGFLLHLGSTGCVKDASGKVAACQSPNRPEIALDGFAPGSQAIVVDLAALFSATDLTKEVECMSGPGAADCPPLFERLGLPYGAAPAFVQALFRIE